MDYRRRKQIIIASLLALVLILLLAGAYYKWFYNAPTCFDNKQNQKEEGVDCGGPCAISCERLTIKDLQIEWVKFLPLKDNHYDLAAKITNPNPNFGLGELAYIFRLYDASGAKIKEQTGSSFIAPGQKKYLVEGNVTTDKPIDKVELAITKSEPVDWQKLKEGFQMPNIYVHDKQFKFLEKSAATAQASGIIKNDSLFDFDTISVAIVLFDENKEVVGVNKTEARTVPAGEERYFAALWFNQLAPAVTNVDMQAETNLFLDENFMRRFGVLGEKFQEYGPTTSQ